MTKLEKLLSQTGGRFFGLHMRNGEALNVQTVRVSNKFVNIVDNNTLKARRVPKQNISHLVINGRKHKV